MALPNLKLTQIGHFVFGICTLLGKIEEHSTAPPPQMHLEGDMTIAPPIPPLLGHLFFNFRLLLSEVSVIFFIDGLAIGFRFFETDSVPAIMFYIDLGTYIRW